MDNEAQTKVVTASDNTLKDTRITVVDASGGESVTPVNGFNGSNEADRIAPRQVVSGVSRGRQLLGSPNIYVDSSNEQIIAAPNGIPQVLMGNQETFGEGLYVTKPGIDATTNTDPNNFIFNSNRNILKVLKIGTITLPGHTFKTVANQYGGNQTSVDYVHNLGFAPIVLAFNGDPVNGYFPIPTAQVPTAYNSNSFTTRNVTYVVDSSVLHFTLNSFGYNYTVSTVVADQIIKFYLLQETVS